MAADRQKSVQSAAVDYVGSPDMAAFTIGRVVIAMLAGDRPLSEAALLTWLNQIAGGNTEALPAGVNAEMAAGALQHLARERQANADGAV